MVDGLVSTHMDNYKKSGAELVFGEGGFVGPKTSRIRLSNGGVPHFALLGIDCFGKGRFLRGSSTAPYISRFGFAGFRLVQL